MALLAVFAAANTLVYGVDFFGVGSSRNKILPMVLVFLFVCYRLDSRATSRRPMPGEQTVPRLEPAV